MPRQTPAEYAREVFETLTASGSDYATAMHEARIALTDAQLDDDEIAVADTFPQEWAR